ncbi:unnamed protein product [Caenorhabditis nigoni]
MKFPSIILLALVGFGAAQLLNSVENFPDDNSCNAGTFPQTALFAYSNDLPTATVIDSWEYFVDVKSYGDNYSWFGSARFDIENIDMQFYTTINQSTILNSLPDPTQGFLNSSIGSNVFDVIEKFFSNTQAPVCGARILVLLKRYPNKADTSRLVSLIRSHHAIVDVITSSTPSGGSQPKAMYSVASKTNGLGAFEEDEAFGWITHYLPLYDVPYLVYAVNVQVSGKGTITLPNFHPSDSYYYQIFITFQDHVDDESMRRLSLRWTNPEDPEYSADYTIYLLDVFMYWGGGTYVANEFYILNVNLNMTLEYSYSGQDVQNIQIRIESSIPPSNWLPYID